MIGNQRYQVTSFRYINQADGVSHLVMVSKVLGDMKYVTRPVKRAAEVVGIWTEDNRDVHIGTSFYTKVSWKFNFKKK